MAMSCINNLFNDLTAHWFMSNIVLIYSRLFDGMLFNIGHVGRRCGTSWLGVTVLQRDRHCRFVSAVIHPSNVSVKDRGGGRRCGTQINCKHI